MNEDAGYSNVEALMRQIAREEIASLAGLMMRRLQNEVGAIDARMLQGLWGETLADFSGHTKGEAPG